MWLQTVSQAPRFPHCETVKQNKHSSHVLFLLGILVTVTRKVTNIVIVCLRSQDLTADNKGKIQVPKGKRTEAISQYS